MVGCLVALARGCGPAVDPAALEHAICHMGTRRYGQPQQAGWTVPRSVNAMDREWIQNYLEESLALFEGVFSGTASDRQKCSDAWQERAVHVAVVVEKLLPRRGPDISRWAVSTNRLTTVGTIRQAIYANRAGIEVIRRLGPPPGPQLRADALHPTVWDAAKSFWRSEHYLAAVDHGADAVNAALQKRLGRRDISNTRLAQQAFTLNPPEPGKPRLRLWPDDGSETYTSIHAGARDFAAGCFEALRNVAAHERGQELGEQEALEQLAAFSIVARWVEQADVDVAGDDEHRAG